MHAYLICGGSEKTREEKTAGLIKKLKAERLEFEIRKIAQVRNLKNITKLTLPKETAVVINGIDEATEEAQNALLKSLEEPQEKLIFILTCKGEEGVLSTIVSRCEVIKLKPEVAISKEARKEFDKFWKLSTARKLVEITKINKREEAIEFAERLISGGWARMREDETVGFGVEKMLKGLNNLKANGNVQLQLTAMVIDL